MILWPSWPTQMLQLGTVVTLTETVMCNLSECHLESMAKRLNIVQEGTFQGNTTLDIVHQWMTTYGELLRIPWIVT